MLIRENQVKTSSAGIQDLGTGSDSNLESFAIIVRLILLGIFCMQEISTVANISQPALGGYMKVGLVNFLRLPFFILCLPKFWTLNKIGNLFLMRSEYFASNHLYFCR